MTNLRYYRAKEVKSVLPDHAGLDQRPLTKIPAYPVLDDGFNLRVLILSRSKLQKALHHVDNYRAPQFERRETVKPLQ